VHYLAQELDPASRRKTLIFCVSDSHADLVVDLLKQPSRRYTAASRTTP
jgi:type I site-specific restriction endonuclease